MATRRRDKEGPSTAERVKELSGQLEQGVIDVFASGRFQEYLDVMRRFHRYSANNGILIWLQRPDATLVAGYNDWIKKFHRHVMKGEKAIRILAPCTYKKTVEEPAEDGGEPQKKVVTRVSFKPVSVFDVSQTDGEPIPELAHTLEGEPERAAEYFEALRRASPVPVSVGPVDGGANGYYAVDAKQVVVKEGLPPMQQLKTLAHEIAHAELIGSGLDDLSDNMASEVMAEGCAYTVMGYLGLDTSDYSFGYVASWSSGKEAPELKRTLDTIQKCSCGIIERFDEALERVVAERAAEAPEVVEEWVCTDPDAYQWMRPERTGEGPLGVAYRVVQPVFGPQGWCVDDRRVDLSLERQPYLDTVARAYYDGGLDGIAQAYGTGPFGAPDFQYSILAEIVSEWESSEEAPFAEAAQVNPDMESAARQISREVLSPDGVGPEARNIGVLEGSLARFGARASLERREQTRRG